MTVSENYYNSTKISISNNKNELLQAEQNFEKMRQGVFCKKIKEEVEVQKLVLLLESELELLLLLQQWEYLYLQHQFY